MHSAHLDAGQQAWVKRFDEGNDFGVWMIARQRGKSYAALYADVMFANRVPGAICRYLGQTKDSAQSIAGPTLDQIFALCPDRSLLPHPYSKNNTLGDNHELNWPNGSVMKISGTDNESFRRQRGPRSHRITFDESAFYPKLKEVEDALLPSLQTTANIPGAGKPLYLSTPPLSVGHEFVARYRAAQAAGRAEHETIHDNPRLSTEDVMNIAKREAVRLGMTLEELLESTYWKREYLAEIVTEESRAAVPGWDEDAARVIVAEHTRPPHFDGYVGVDWGFGDPHGAVFGYWDFVSGMIVIEYELEMRNTNTQALAECIKDIETLAWGTTGWDGTLLGAGFFDANTKSLPEFLKAAISERAPRQPYLRVGDDDQLVLADMIQQHKLAIMPTRKDDKALAVNELDILVRHRKLRIHPRCKRLIQQLYSTTWNKQRTQWERTAEGHGDVLDALIYMVRNVFRHKDPRPPAIDDFWQPQTINKNELAIAQAFGQNRRRQ